MRTAVPGVTASLRCPTAAVRGRSHVCYRPARPSSERARGGDSGAALLSRQSVRPVLVRPLRELALGLFDIAIGLLEQLVDDLLVTGHLLPEPVVHRAVRRVDDLTALSARSNVVPAVVPRL